MTTVPDVEAARRAFEEVYHRFLSEPNGARDPETVLAAERACHAAARAGAEFFGSSTAAFAAYCGRLADAWPRIRRARAELFEGQLTPDEQAGLDLWLVGRDIAQARTFIERLERFELDGYGPVQTYRETEFPIERNNVGAFATAGSQRGAGARGVQLRQEPEVLRAARRYVERWIGERILDDVRGMRMLVGSCADPVITRAARDAAVRAARDDAAVRLQEQMTGVATALAGAGVSAAEMASALQACAAAMPGPPITKEAKARARELLLSRLSENQRQTFEDRGAFVVRSQRGNDYRIEAKWQVNVTCASLNSKSGRLGDRPTVDHRYCLTVPGVPLDDQLLAQKILLENDEAGFHAKAIDHGPGLREATRRVNEAIDEELLRSHAAWMAATPWDRLRSNMIVRPGVAGIVRNDVA